MIVVDLHVKKEIEPAANTIESSIVMDGLDSSQTYMLAIGVATDSGNNLGDVSETGTYISCKCKQISHLDLLKCLKKLILITSINILLFLHIVTVVSLSSASDGAPPIVVAVVVVVIAVLSVLRTSHLLQVYMSYVIVYINYIV